MLQCSLIVDGGRHDDNNEPRLRGRGPTVDIHRAGFDLRHASGCARDVIQVHRLDGVNHDRLEGWLPSRASTHHLVDDG